MDTQTRFAQPKTARAARWICLAAGILALVVMACNFSVNMGNETAVPAVPTVDAAATLQALQVEQAAQLQATQNALAVQATLLAEQQAAQQSTQAAMLAAAEAQPTAPPPATLAPPEPATAEPAPTQPAATPTPDMDALIKDAKILLFEDVAGYYELTRWVRDALDSKGYRYTDVGDAVGNFKAEILSGKEWDLIIVAAEARSGFRGELFEYLSDQVNKDTAVIIETWYLDQMALGPISDITSNCGVRFQKDWMDPDRDSRSIVWLDPEHPLFHAPNEGFSLVHYSPYWEGDAGDMIMYRSGGGEGEILAGLYTWEKGKYGMLASCNEGRVILQTFSTHDYRKSDMTDLWQNYVYYTLKNHFLKLQGAP